MFTSLNEVTLNDIKITLMYVTAHPENLTALRESCKGFVIIQYIAFRRCEDCVIVTKDSGQN